MEENAVPAAEVQTADTTPDATVEAQSIAPAPDNSAPETPAEQPEGEQPEVAEQAKPDDVEKIKHATQRRIDKMTRKLAEAQTALAEAQNRLQQFEVKAPSTDGAPVETDFNSYEDYMKAVGKWEAKQELQAEQQAKQQQELQALEAEKLSAMRKQFEAAETEFRAQTPDYDEKVETLNEFLEFLPDTAKKSESFNVFKQIMLNSPVMPQLSYELGSDADLLEGLTKKTPLEIARELFYREYKIANTPKKTTQPKPVAPPPAPVGGVAKGQKPLSADMDSNELMVRLGLYKKGR